MTRDRLEQAAWIVGAIGLLASMIGWIVTPHLFPHAWLAALACWIGWPLGSMALLLIHSVSGGRWGVGHGGGGHQAGRAQDGREEAGRQGPRDREARGWGTSGQAGHDDRQRPGAAGGRGQDHAGHGQEAQAREAHRRWDHDPGPGRRSSDG